MGGEPPNTNYLFLGGYVDFGYFGVETICLLGCLLLKYPSRICLLRGSHESRLVSEVYGFYSECVKKYGNSNVWRYITEAFDYLPLCAIIENSIFCVHGGLSPSFSDIDQIKVLNRFQEIPPKGPITDLMWSDPSTKISGFSPNPQGSGYIFGEDIVEKFTRNNSIQHIFRSHQLCFDGYQQIFNGKLSTIWSTPNFCYTTGNTASIIEVDDNLHTYYNTYLEAPDTERIIPTPDLYKETPDYYSISNL